MMRRMTIAVIAAALVIAIPGCGGQGETPGEADGAAPAPAGSTSQADDMVAKAARIAVEIRARPDDAAAILEKHGTTREEFERMLYDIAADPGRSRAYNEAMGR